MKENNKLYDAVLDLGLAIKSISKQIGEVLIRMDMLVARMDKLEGRMDKLEARMDKMEARMDKMEHEQHKINALLAENNRAIIKLANRQDEHSEKIASLEVKVNSLEVIVLSLRSDFNRFADSNEARINGHEERIIRLEEKTGNTYFAGEPALRYKKKKRKR